MVLRRIRAAPDERPAPTNDAKRLAALTEIVRVLGSSNDYDSLLFDSARAARMALDGASVAVARWERGLGQIRVLVNEGDLAPWEVERPTDEVYSVRRDPALTDLMVRGRGYVVVLGESGDPSSHAVLFETNKTSAVDVPIVVEGQVWGDLWVARNGTQPHFDERDLDYATVVAAQVGAAIAAGDRLARVSRLAYTDALTGLANRRAVDERLDTALESHQVSNASVSLLVCDVNGLKAINDERGHEAGDRALIQLAGILSGSAALAPGSLAARLGGDEFCIVMEGHSGDLAVRVADDLTRRAAQLLPQGISCGVASTDDDVGLVRSPGRLFRLADAAQYRAKRSRSRHPVAAGRSVAAEASSHHSDRDQGGDRRQMRGRSHLDVGRVIEVGVAALDDAVDASPGDRMERVAEALSQQADAAGWWLSVNPTGAPYVRTVACAVYRTAPPEAGRVEMAANEVGAEFPLSSFPLTTVALDGSAQLVSIEDPYADPAEIAIIQGMGCVELLIAGGKTSDGERWLIEIFADEISAPMRSLVAAVRVLVALALS